jgi:hypothetical protein
MSIVFEMAEGHFINPSEFIGRTPKKPLKNTLFRLENSEVVEGHYPGGMLPTSHFVRKKRHIFAIFRKNALFSPEKVLFCTFFLIISSKRAFLGPFWGFGRPSKRP